MKSSRFGSRNVATVAVFVSALAIGCGGGGGGGGGGGTATVTGNVSSASAAVSTQRQTWLAWLGEHVLTVARRAYAASVGGVGVSVTGPGGSSATDTDSGGDFTVGNAPSGDVTVTFSRGNCQASVPLDDVTDGSTLDLKDVDFACGSAQVRELDETFQAVLENKPSSPNGNLNVCAFGGGGNHIRAVKTKNGTQFEDPSGGPATFQDLVEGDLIEVTGVRAGIGANSAVDASTVRIISSGHTGNCAGLSTPTPTATATPTATPTGTPSA